MGEIGGRTATTNPPTCLFPLSLWTVCVKRVFLAIRYKNNINIPRSNILVNVCVCGGDLSG